MTFFAESVAICLSVSLLVGQEKFIYRKLDLIVKSTIEITSGYLYDCQVGIIFICTDVKYILFSIKGGYNQDNGVKYLDNLYIFVLSIIYIYCSKFNFIALNITIPIYE